MKILAVILAVAALGALMAGAMGAMHVAAHQGLADAFELAMTN